MARNIEFDVLAHDRASATFDKVGRSAEHTHGILSKIGKGAALALGGAATAIAGFGAAGVVMGIKTAAANEQASIAFTTMLGSARKARAFLGQLQQFAAQTPFEFPELQTAASSLISAGINANKVIPIMRTLGNVTSGMGTGSEGVKRATVALQQMSAAGKITGEDLNQLRDAGIPVYDLLAKATGKSKAEVVKLAAAGKLGHKELGQMMKALESGKGLERFSGLMDKQSRSLTGLWSTLKDTLGQGLATAIQPAVPLIKEGLGKGIELVAANMPKVAAGVAKLVASVKGANFTPITEAFDRLKSVDISAVMSKIAAAFHQLAPAAADVGQTLPALGPTMHVFGQAASFAAGHVDLLRKALPFLVAGLVAYKAAQIANRTIGRDSIIGFTLQIGSTLTMAAANFALAKSMRLTATAGAQSVAVENLSTVSRIRGTVATVASAVAQKAAAAAAKVFAAVQWLVNAALSANPIGLVIVAIAALAAGLVYAYKHSETFRNVVNTAFRAVAATARWLWNSVLAPVIRFILTGFANLAHGVAVFLSALGRIPHFGWATAAAAKMETAARKARELAAGIRSIPSSKSVTVSYHIVGLHALQQARILADMGRQHGGPILKGRPYVVGEKGPELVIPSANGLVLDAAKTAAIMANRPGSPLIAGGGGGGVINIYINGPSIGTPSTIAQQIHQALMNLQRERGTSLRLA